MAGKSLSEHLTLRVPKRVPKELDAMARRRAVTATALARRYVEEGLRMDRHPGIVFREGAAGRRAAIEGRRLDVWQVIETVRASKGEIDEAADYLGLRPDQVRAALAYYAEFQGEIKEWIAANREEAKRAREAHLRQQKVLGR